jgi:hypothetical protein
LIDRVGLEDASELVALASGDQLQAIFDQDLWRADAPGQDEFFRADRFVLWLEIMSDAGERFLVDRLCELPMDFLALGISHLVLVVDTDRLWEGIIDTSEEVERLERALEAPLYEDWEGYRLLARDPEHWDVVWAALLALDRDHHDRVQAVLEQCCVVSSESIKDRGGLFHVLTHGEMLESDVTGEREDRRSRQGFVAAADARSFLALARTGEHPDERDPVTRAHFRELRRADPAGNTIGVHGQDPTRRPADARRLIRILEEASVLPSRHDRLLLAPSDASTSNAEEGSRALARFERGPVQFFEAVLADLRAKNPELFSNRIEELHYLANVLVAGSTDRRPRPVEALEEEIAVCAAGLESAIGREGSLANGLVCLENESADQLFRQGYRRHISNRETRDCG